MGKKFVKGKTKVTVVTHFEEEEDGLLAARHKTGYVPNRYIKVYENYDEEYCALLLTSRRILKKILFEFTLQRKEVRLDIEFMLWMGYEETFFSSFTNAVSELKKGGWIVKNKRMRYTVNGTKIYCGAEKHRMGGTILLPESDKEKTYEINLDEI